MTVFYTERFERQYRALPEQLKTKVDKQVRLQNDTCVLLSVIPHPK